MTKPTTDAALERVRARIEQCDTLPTLHELAAVADLSATHLQRAFRRRYGVSPAEYHRARRFDQLRQSLRDGSAVTEAVYDAASARPAGCTSTAIACSA
jgi:AraC family transcriptional regulator of adaptative response/methylated-DNA-[protein]-cysteine methyltransferase